jgi:hypothetical protein
MFSWFDHPLVDWLAERRLRPPRTRERATARENRLLQRLEVTVIEPLPDIARESIEGAAVHPLDESTPDLDDDARAGEGDVTVSGPAY